MQPVDQMDIGELIPHRAPMQLLSGVLTADNEHVWSYVSLSPQSPFVELRNASVPTIIMLEYLAQTAAAFFSLQALAEFENQPAAPPAPRPGMLIGCSRLSTSVPAIAVPTTLVIQASLASALPQTPEASALVRFTGKVFDLATESAAPRDAQALVALACHAAPIADAALSVFLPTAQSTSIPTGSIQ